MKETSFKRLHTVKLHFMTFSKETIEMENKSMVARLQEGGGCHLRHSSSKLSGASDLHPILNVAMLT